MSIEIERSCPRCGTLVTLTPARIKRGRYTCQPCTNKVVREWNLNHPEQALASARRRVRAYQLRHPEKRPTKAQKHTYDREWTLRRKYNISVADYDALVAKQDGRCAICAAGPGGKGVFHVDHSHADGHIRGLLCARCNLGIGAFHEDPQILRAAIEYIIYAALRRTA